MNTPKQAISLRNIIAIALVIFISGNIAAKTESFSKSKSTNSGAFEPTPEHSKISSEIVRTLKKHHYQNVVIDDQFSSKLLDHYLELLDPNKSHFLVSDIKSFEKYRYQLDNDVEKGRLDAAFDIYNRFHQRRLERINFVLDKLPERIEKFDFAASEHIRINRDEAPWLLDEEVAHDLWRKMLKNEVLGLRLTDKTNAEIAELLEKRYKSQLRLLNQTNNDDVFQLFIGSYTHNYDPHTDYFPPRESENFNIHMRLSLEGIGALLQREDEYIKVVRLIPAGPADRSKLLKPADKIIGVGQGEKGEITDVVGWRLDDVVDLIRGPKGSVVRLNLMPSDATDSTKTRLISITRDRVKLEEQSAKKKVINIEYDNTPYKIGVIELPTFYVDFKAAMAGNPNYRSSTRDVEKLVYELREEGIDGLVIDLRNNGGGSLQEANDLTGLFIKTGPVVQIRNAKNKIELIGDSNPKVVYTGPLAVLVNRLSASASEIFAAAMQDHGRGIVIGSQTFGKGTVQNINRLNNDEGQLKYTQAKFYRVSGGSTQAKGIIPDIPFPELLNKQEIGENTLPESLPWDRIPATRYRPIYNLESAINIIRENHKKRITDNPDFNYLDARIAMLEENRHQTKLSLNQEERIKERENARKRILTMENIRRKANNLPEFKNYGELEAYNTDTENQDDGPDNSILRETGNILIDWLTLQNKYALN